jgi:hypothetical protein
MKYISKKLNFIFYYICAFLMFSESALSTENPIKFSTYLVSMTDANGSNERIASKNEPLAEFTIRPDRGATLKGIIDPEIGKAAGVNSKFPFIKGYRLYGWPDYPGLYCDLMRNRGLGSVAACLHDEDKDGKFDSALRFEFRSSHADVVFITDKQKTRGGAFVGSIRLTTPLPYDTVTGDDFPSAKMKLWWNSITDNKEPENNSVKLKFSLSEGSNFTGTEILSAEYYSTKNLKIPSEFDIYGIRIRVVGFDDKNGLIYNLSQMQNSEPVAFGFRGYVNKISIVVLSHR